MPLNPTLIFERYVPSSARAPALAACAAFAARRQNTQSCLWLHGPPGVGKTHLLHATGHAACLARTGTRVGVIGAADLRDELVQAVRFDRVDAWQESHTQWDLLLVDDLHVLSGRPATQWGVARLFAACLRAGGAVACALTGGAGVVRRLAQCRPERVQVQVVPLGRLSSPHLVRVLQNEARDRDLGVPVESLRRLARQSRGDARVALGGLARWQLRQISRD
jgi:chromosomal replication initiator protein